MTGSNARSWNFILDFNTNYDFVWHSSLHLHYIKSNFPSFFRIEWELLGTGPYEPRNGFGNLPPFRGRGFPCGQPPVPRWNQHGGAYHYRPRSRGHNNHNHYNRNDYSNFRGQNGQQGRNRPRPFIRLSNRGGRYFFNERQGFDQGQGRGRGRTRGHTQGHHRGRGRGAHLSYSPSSGSDSDEETEYQKKIQVSEEPLSHDQLMHKKMWPEKWGGWPKVLEA